MTIDYSQEPFKSLKSQDYITRFLTIYYSERFVDDECYLEEKLDVFKEFENKYDALMFLLFTADKETKEEFCNQRDLTITELKELSELFRKI